MEEISRIINDKIPMHIYGVENLLAIYENMKKSHVILQPNWIDTESELIAHDPIIPVLISYASEEHAQNILQPRQNQVFGAHVKKNEHFRIKPKTVISNNEYGSGFNNSAQNQYGLVRNDLEHAYDENSTKDSIYEGRIPVCTTNTHSKFNKSTAQSQNINIITNNYNLNHNTAQNHNLTYDSNNSHYFDNSTAHTHNISNNSNKFDNLNNSNAQTHNISNNSHYFDNNTAQTHNKYNNSTNFTAHAQHYSNNDLNNSTAQTHNNNDSHNYKDSNAHTQTKLNDSHNNYNAQNQNNSSNKFNEHLNSNSNAQSPSKTKINVTIRDKSTAHVQNNNYNNDDEFKESEYLSDEMHSAKASLIHSRQASETFEFKDSVLLGTTNDPVRSIDLITAAVVNTANILKQSAENDPSVPTNSNIIAHDSNKLDDILNNINIQECNAQNQNITEIRIHQDNSIDKIIKIDNAHAVIETINENTTSVAVDINAADIAADSTAALRNSGSTTSYDSAVHVSAAFETKSLQDELIEINAAEQSAASTKNQPKSSTLPKKKNNAQNQTITTNNAPKKNIIKPYKNSSQINSAPVSLAKIEAEQLKESNKDAKNEKNNDKQAKSTKKTGVQRWGNNTTTKQENTPKTSQNKKGGKPKISEEESKEFWAAAVSHFKSK